MMYSSPPSPVRLRRLRAVGVVAVASVVLTLLLCGTAFASYSISGTCNANPDVWTYGNVKHTTAYTGYYVSADVTDNASGGVCLRIVKWSNSGYVYDPGHRFQSSDPLQWNLLTYSMGSNVDYRYKWRQYTTGSNHVWAGNGHHAYYGD